MNLKKLDTIKTPENWKRELLEQQKITKESSNKKNEMGNGKSGVNSSMYNGNNRWSRHFQSVWRIFTKCVRNKKGTGGSLRNYFQYWRN